LQQRYSLTFTVVMIDKSLDADAITTIFLNHTINSNGIFIGDSGYSDTVFFPGSWGTYG